MQYSFIEEYITHGTEAPIMPSYLKMVDWLYSKKVCSLAQRKLRRYMLSKIMSKINKKGAVIL